MQCFVCLTQGEHVPAVTYVQGSSVCAEHAVAFIQLADMQQRLDRIVKANQARNRVAQRKQNNGKAALRA